MKIKDVEKQVGISKANIRFYEEEGLIHPARNQENNYREYSETDVEQLQEIKKLRLIGIPVQEIKEIYEDRLTLQEALSRRLDEIEKEERTLKETKLTCQKALKSKLDITSIDQLEIEEEKSDRLYNCPQKQQCQMHFHIRRTCSYDQQTYHSCK